MNKIALILLLGFSFVVAENIDADEYADDEVEYVEEYDEVVADDEAGDEGYADNEEYIEEVGNVADEYTEDSASPKARGNMTNDATDITRWTYSEQDLAKKAASAKRKAKQEAEYKQSIKRKRSGLFFGGGVGYSGLNLSNLSLERLLSVQGVGLGVFVGYQQAFNEYSGIRFYGEFDYNLGNGVFIANIDGTTYTAPNTNWKGLGNIDFYLEGNMGRNYTETLGFFFGLGAGYLYDRYVSNNKMHNHHLIAMNVNFGVHTILGTHHRIELFGRVYPYITDSNGAGSNNSSFSPGVNMDAWLRYSYMF